MRLKILALCTVVSAGSAFPQVAVPSPAGERAAMLKTLQHGKAITVGTEQYRHLPEVLAVERKTSARTPHDALGLVGASAAEVIETKGRLVLYRAGETNAALVRRVGASPVYPTVLNIRTGALGVLTGTLVVKPKDMADADAIASGHGLEKTRSYPQLKTVFYRAKANVDIADVSAALQADPRVERAYPEVIERVRVPR